MKRFASFLLMVFLPVLFPAFAQSPDTPDSGESLLPPVPPAEQSAPESDGVTFRLHLLFDPGLISVNLENPPALNEWIKSVLQGLEQIVNELDPKPSVLIHIKLANTGRTHFEIFSSPPLESEHKNEIMNILSQNPAPRVKYSDFSLLLLTADAEGTLQEQLQGFPGFVNPHEIKINTFRTAGTAERLVSMKKWTRKEVLPMIADFAKQAEEKYEGIVTMGNRLANLDYTRGIDVEELTSRNYFFWRALLEMSPNDPLIAAAQIFLYVAEGKLDYAQRLLYGTLPFSDPKSAPTGLLKELEMYLDMFQKPVRERILKGIDHFRKGEHDRAEETYLDVLDSYPQSSWALYELFQTLRKRAMEQQTADPSLMPDWNEWARKIYAADPVYPFQASATGPDSIYRLVRRMELKELLQKPMNEPEAFYRYADIATDLDAFGFAALLFHRVRTFFKPEKYGNRDVLGEFLFCLHRLGVPRIQTHFKPEQHRPVEQVRADRLARMKNHAAFQALLKQSAEQEKPGAPPAGKVPEKTPPTPPSPPEPKPVESSPASSPEQ